MANISLSVNLGKGLGSHKLDMVVEHTGLGYLSFVVKNVPIIRQLSLKPKVDMRTIHKIDDMIGHIEDYLDLQETNLKAAIPFKNVSDDITIDVVEYSKMAKLPLPIQDVQIDAKELLTALKTLHTTARVEYTRSSGF